MDSSVTPLHAASQPSQQPPSPPSGLDQALSKLPGTAVQLFTIHKLSQALLSSLQAPCADSQWRWALLGTIVVVVVPWLASSVFDLAGRFLSKRSSPP